MGPPGAAPDVTAVGGAPCMDDALHAQCARALALFLDAPTAAFTRAHGGINNITAFVDIQPHVLEQHMGQVPQRFVLRISNNGGREDKVAYELEVLRQLGQLPLSFQVPRALPSKHGRPYEVLPSSGSCSTSVVNRCATAVKDTGSSATAADGSCGSGEQATELEPAVCVCVWHLIPGALAGPGSIEAVGAAVGELTAALARVRVPGRDPPNPPIWDLFRVHEAIGNAETFYQAVESTAMFDAAHTEMRALVTEVRRLEGRLAALAAAGLPTQLIHGDLHYDNMLVHGDQVSGVLDFEFLALDYRTMELAIALSKYISEADPLAACRAFMVGYIRHITLCDAEVSAVPTLVALRILSNVVWFVGRALAGEDSPETLTGRAGAYVRRLAWLGAHGDALVACIRELQAAVEAGAQPTQ